MFYDPSKKLCFKAGTRIFSIGEEGVEAYIIEKGEVELSADQDGKTIIIDNIGEKGIFGEMSILSSGKRIVNATAINDCEVYPISKQQLNKIIDQSSPFIKALLRVMAKTVEKLTEEK